MKLPSQFSLRTLLEVIALAAFFCVLLFLRMPSVNSAGRYQMYVYPGNIGHIMIFDTQTGQVWYVQDVKEGQPFDPKNPSASRKFQN
jgi:hypothetical protein